MFIWNSNAASVLAISAIACTIMGRTFDSGNLKCIPSPSGEFKAIYKQFTPETAVDRILGRRFAQKIGISVYVHIVAGSQNETDGYLSVSRTQFLLLRFRSSCALLSTPPKVFLPIVQH